MDLSQGALLDLDQRLIIELAREILVVDEIMGLLELNWPKEVFVNR